MKPRTPRLAPLAFLSLALLTLAAALPKHPAAPLFDVPLTIDVNDGHTFSGFFRSKTVADDGTILFEDSGTFGGSTSTHQRRVLLNYGIFFVEGPDANCNPNNPVTDISETVTNDVILHHTADASATPGDVTTVEVHVTNVETFPGGQTDPWDLNNLNVGVTITKPDGGSVDGTLAPQAPPAGFEASYIVVLPSPFLIDGIASVDVRFAGETEPTTFDTESFPIQFGPCKDLGLSTTESTGSTQLELGGNVVVLTIDESAPGGPPVSDAGDDQTVECAAPAGTPVTLDGSGSSDPDGDPLTFTWTDAAGSTLATGETPTVSLPPGEQTVTLTVDDGQGGSDTDEVIITVEDTTDPVVTVGAPAQDLWPANHAAHPILLDDLGLSATDACDGDLSAEVVVTRATSDEPKDAAGDGSTLDDIIIACDRRAVDLLAERKGNGNGRVYTLHMAVPDASGNVGEAAYQVFVPHDEGGPAIDDGAAAGHVEVGCPLPPDDPGVSVTSVPEQALASSARLAERVPETFALHGNYPNPFNPQTTIRFDVPQRAHVRLQVFNVLGQPVETLFDAPMAPGTHQAVFNAGDLPSGVYFYHLEAGAFTGTRPMILLK